MSNTLTDRMFKTIKSAATKLTGFKRRAYMAEVAAEYCDGSARKAERWFGWGREAVRVGLHEKRTGVRCLENFAARGRKKTEEKAPQLVEQIERIVEPHAQADPKFQTPFAFTRITASVVREELLKNDELQAVIPSRQTVGEILNRMGYRLRRVVKTRVEKRSPKQMTSSRTSRLVAKPLARTRRA